MWEYLTGLPSALSVTVIVLGLTSIVIISLKGTAVVRWGKNLVGLGKTKITETSEEGTVDIESKQPTVSPPTATALLRMPKRGCGDCILIIMGEREKYELKISSTQDKVLRNQMNFFEQKMVEIQELIEKVFSDLMESTKRQAAIVAAGKSVDIEYKFFTELLKDALMIAKNEIRRSYKDNDYFDMADSDFSMYIKDKNRLIVNLIVQHVKSMYPSQGMTVTALDFQSSTMFVMPQMHDILRECFEYAKEITRESQAQIEGFHKEFSIWIDKFVSEK